MGASEQPKNEEQREPEEDKVRSNFGRQPDGGYDLPLFLRDKSDGRKGDAQDEKDGIGE
ncbi:MAG: hypothetical protein QOH49_2070 [Acidobacteriota bacterium]|jgi:hypothetical protein|nr:hypothetical protein [Acidobacteriota bacterium]